MKHQGKSGNSFLCISPPSWISPQRLGYGDITVFELQTKRKKTREKQTLGKFLWESPENDTIFPSETTADSFNYLLLPCIVPGGTKREACGCLYSSFSWVIFSIFMHYSQKVMESYLTMYIHLYMLKKRYPRNRKYNNPNAFRIITKLLNQGHLLAKWINRNLGCILDFFSKR